MMTKIFQYASILLLSMITTSLWSQTNEEYSTIINYERELKNQQMSNAETSPLSLSAIADFDSLDYYPVDSKFRIEGQLNTTDSQNVSLKTTSNSNLNLSKYGAVDFTFDGKKYSLIIYRSNNFPEFGDANQQLFIPFSDLTSGKETNDNGRYLAVNVSSGDNKVILDFNKSINPYSAYSSKYTSVLPPAENQLVFGIVSGERKYEHREK